LIRRSRKWLVRNPIPAILLLTAVAASTAIIASLFKTRQALADARAQMYFSAIQLASRDANEKNFQQAEDQLKRAPEELRGWEWHHINRIAHPEAAVWEPNLGGMKIVGSQDGKTLLAAISSTAGIAALIDPETGQKTVEFARTPGTMNIARNTLISLSADSQLVAIGDGLSIGFFKRDGTLLKTLTWPAAGKVMGMALDANGRRLAVTTFEHRVQVRDIESGEFTFNELRVEVMANQPRWRDGDRQLVVVQRHGLGIDTLANPKLHRIIPFLDMSKQLPPKQGLDNEVNIFEGLAISPDGRTAAIGGVGIIVLIDLETMTVVRKLECEFAVRGAVKQFINLQCLVFSPDGRYLVGISPMDRAVRIWDINLSLPLAVHYGHPPFPLGAAFLPGGSQVVTVGDDVKARLWDVPPKPYPHALPDNGQKLVATYMEVSRDGKYLAVGEDEGFVSLYDTQTEKLLWRVRPATRAITQLTFSPDGTRIGVAPGWEGSHSARGAGVTKENRDAIVLATESGATLFKLTPAPGEWSMVKSISFRSDGKRILTAGGFTDADGDTVREWDAASGAHLADFDVGYVKLNGRKMNTATSGVAYDPSGRDEFAVCGSNHPDTHICSAADGKGRVSLVKHGTISGVIYSDFWVGYSRDGRFVLTHDHTTLGVWERHSSLFSLSEACQYRFRMANLPRFTQVAISPDGLRLALASNDFIIIRSTLSGEELIRIPIAGCEAVAFHPDGKRLYAGYAGDVVCYDP
jgi:WD40 repeat protein